MSVAVARGAWRGVAILGVAVADVVVAGVALAAGAAPPAPGARISFVACPIARDTGPDTDLCFFTQHDGQAYTLNNPSDFGMPQLRHRMLVEGTVTATPGACGGLSFEGRASVLAEVDTACNEVVPYDGVHQGRASGVFNSGTPAQRAYAEDLARRAAADPSLSVLPAIPDAPAKAPPEPPFTARSQTILYPFDSDRSSGPDMLALQELARYALAAKARVQVRGYRAASRLTDGSLLAEKPQRARDRAQKIGGILQALGVAANDLSVSWSDTLAPGTGRDDWRNRRVEVAITPRP